MKKMIAVAAAVVTGVALAGEALTSSNVVGYQNFGKGEWITEAGAAFASVSGNKWTCSDSVFDNEVISGDMVHYFSSEVWNLNTYVFNGFLGSGENLGWAYSYTDTETWEPAESTVQSYELNKGDTIFYQPSDAVSGLTVAGQVQDPSQSATWSLPADEWIGDIMNPFPVDTTLADLEKFAVTGDTVLVFSTFFWNLDTYIYNGPGLGWAVSTFDEETWEEKSFVITDTSTVVLPSGIGGCYQPADTNGRTWTVTLNK